MWRTWTGGLEVAGGDGELIEGEEGDDVPPLAGGIDEVDELVLPPPPVDVDVGLDVDDVAGAEPVLEVTCSCALFGGVVYC